MLFFTGIIVNIMVGLSLRYIFQSVDSPFFQRNVANYFNYLIEEIGIPPDLNKTKSLSQELSFDIYIEQEDPLFSTFDKVPALDSIHMEHQYNNVYGGWTGRRFIVQVKKEDYNFIISPKHESRLQLGYQFILIVLLVLSIIFLMAVAIMRYLLKPVKMLMDGVDRVSAGRLDYQISVKRKDEFGRLALSFNQMTKKISEMIRARDHLLIDVSHELRSPLTRIKLALEFIKKDSSKQSIQEDIQEMEKMINEILETERLKSEYGGLQRTIQPIIPLIKEVLAPFENLHPGVRLIDNQSVAVQVNIDAPRIKMALRNIVDNALKYSQSSNKPVEMEIQLKNDKLLLGIKDYGQGIPETELPLIFEPFYRVDKSRSRQTGGYGLGMNLCKNIIEAHQGNINVESQFGKGTTILITLPVSWP